jgi:ADP-ribose pyrophosphatase
MPEPADADLQPWKVLASEKLLDCPPWLSVIRQNVQLPTGAIIEDYLLTPGRDFSLIVALLEPPLASEPELLLVRQYKHGLGRAVVEFPAGYLDTPDEAPLACAQRELSEETGYTAKIWEPLGAFCIDPNRARTAAHIFFARDLARASQPHLDATENLQPLTMPVRQFTELLRSGQVATQSTAAAWGLAVSLGFIKL